mmetsp:Transcript_20517/g.52221  ORF Transcript_20517/g.52221 Transcript_20517/m.52221 type:complete len:215 (-) Transcript_20517:167-811(-)
MTAPTSCTCASLTSTTLRGASSSRGTCRPSARRSTHRATRSTAKRRRSVARPTRSPSSRSTQRSSACTVRTSACSQSSSSTTRLSTTTSTPSSSTCSVRRTRAAPSRSQVTSARRSCPLRGTISHASSCCLSISARVTASCSLTSPTTSPCVRARSARRRSPSRTLASSRFALTGPKCCSRRCGPRMEVSLSKSWPRARRSRRRMSWRRCSRLI